MNGTKRKIFEISMELFASKGYDATSIEEITAIVGVAKGTLYYHFSSKEEIFNFLVEQGMDLLEKSVEIKTAKMESSIDKLKEIILIQIKVLLKYENSLKIIASQMWGSETMHAKCRECVSKYIDKIEVIIKEGQERGELKTNNAKLVATNIFGMLCSNLIYTLTTGEEIDIEQIQKEYQEIALGGILKQC